MEFSQVFVDVLRALHLVCFAAGMGVALYFDFRTFQTIKNPILSDEVQSLKRIHNWIAIAFGSTWITGIVLIYIRTDFNLSAFSPKLWLKISIMLLMTWNAHKIGKYIIPIMQKNVGTSLIALPFHQLAIAVQLAIISVFCWTSALGLGSSVVLKTAQWEILLPLAISWLVILSFCGHFIVVVKRFLVPSKPDPK